MTSDSWGMTWSDYVTHLNLLTKQVRDLHSQREFSDIIAIARGGLMPAVAISHDIGPGTTLHIWRACYYFGREQLSNVDLSVKPNIFKRHPDVTNTREVLIVDDVMSTGGTMSAVADELSRQAVELSAASSRYQPQFNVMYASLVVAAKHRLRADVIFGSVVDDNMWVRMPYETA